jgi:hypothetical protein
MGFWISGDGLAAKTFMTKITDKNNRQKGWSDGA